MNEVNQNLQKNQNFVWFWLNNFTNQHLSKFEHSFIIHIISETAFVEINTQSYYGVTSLITPLSRGAYLGHLSSFSTRRPAAGSHKGPFRSVSALNAPQRVLLSLSGYGKRVGGSGDEGDGDGRVGKVWMKGFWNYKTTIVKVIVCVDARIDKRPFPLKWQS